MKSWTLIASYLSKDTCSRWLEQPGSPLARGFVTTLLVGVATMILVSLHLLERSVREKLEQFGVNTLIVRETLSFGDAEFIATGMRADRLAGLADLGSVLRLRQLFVRAQTEWQQDMPTFSYPSVMPPALAQLLSAETPLVCLSSFLPENALVRVQVQRQSGLAIVRRPKGYLRSLNLENLLLVPQGWLTKEERFGYVDTLVFQRHLESPPMRGLVEAIQILFANDHRAPQIQSATDLLQAWEGLKEQQHQARLLLAGVLGLALALVFGSIAVLEFRQNLFVTALLRSFGLPARWLWIRQCVESAALANIAAGLAIGCLWCFHSKLFLALGFPPAVVQFSGEGPYWSVEVGLILALVNTGALLSTVPVAVALKQPVGKVLS